MSGAQTGTGSFTFTGPTTVYANLTTNNQFISFNSPVALRTDSIISTNGGKVTFGSTVDGAFALTVASGSGAVRYNGAVGGMTALTSLSDSGNGTTDLNGNVTTTGMQSFSGPLILGANDTLTTTNSTVTFSSTVDGAFALTVAAGSGTVSYNGTVGGITTLMSLSDTGSGKTNLNGNVTTTGTQMYSGPVLLGANDTLSTTNSNVTFGSTVDGANSLTVAAGAGTVEYNGTVGGTAPLTSLNDTGSGATDLNGNVTTTGIQNYAGAVLLGANDTLTTSNSNVTFGSTVNGAYALNVAVGTGTVEYNGAVGGIAALTSLNDAGSGTTDLNGNVTTTGIQNYAGPVLLGANDTLSTTNSNVTFSSTVNGAYALTVAAGSGTVGYDGTVGGITALMSLSDAGSGTTDLNGNVTTTGSQNYTGPVLLGGNDTLSTTNSNVVFGSSVDGAYTLTVVAGTGTVSYHGTVGGIAALTSLSDTGSGTTDLNGNVTTTGSQAYSGPVLLAADDTLSTTNSNVTFGSTVDGAYGLTVAAGSATIKYNGAVGGKTKLASLNDTGSGATDLNGNVTTTGTQSYSGPLIIGANDTLSTTNSNVTFSSTVDGAFALIVAAGTGTVKYNTTVGGTTALISLSDTGNGTTNLNGNVTTTGNQNYTGSVLLGVNDTLTTTNSNVTFGSTLDGAFALTVVAGSGTVSFAGAVGGSSALTSLNDTGSGTTDLNGNVTTTGSQAYSGPVLLGANDTLSTTNSNVTFSSTVDGANSLTVAAGSGTVSYDGAVGGTTALTSLNDAGSGTTDLKGNVTTTGAQSYSGPLILGNNATLTTTNSNVTFSSTVDGAFALTVAAGTGTVKYNGAVGGTAELTSLSDTGSGTTDLNGNVTTTGMQMYSGPVLLGTNDTLSTTNSNVTFGSTVDGAFALTVAAGSGTVSYDGSVGGSTSLTSLNDTGSGTTDLNGNVTTTGIQNYAGPVLLGANDILSTTNSNVTFGSTIDGAHTLSVAAGSGTVEYNGAIGGTAALTSLNDTGSGATVLNGNVTTTGTQSYSGPLILGANDTLSTTNSNVTFRSTVDGAFALTVAAGSGVVDYDAAVGGTIALTSLNDTGSGATDLNGNVSTTGIQNYAGPVLLGANDTLSTTNSNVTFGSTVDGAYVLTVAAGSGAVSYNGTVGGTKALMSLSDTGSGTTNLNGNVTTTGIQMYSGPVLLGANDTLSTMNSNVTFGSTVDGAFALTVATGAGTVKFNGAVGGSTALTLLNNTGSGTTDLNGNITTTGAQSYSGPLILGANETLSTTNSNVTFGSTVDGAYSLTVAAESGTVKYNGAVGATTALTSLNDTGSGTTDLNGNVTTTGIQNYAGPVLLGANDALTTINSNVTFGSTVDGAYALSVAAGSGTVSYNGTVGGIAALMSLSDTGSGATDLNGNVTTTGIQNYAGRVLLGANNALTTTNSNVTFGSTVDGAYALSVAAGSGTVSYNGTVGGTTALMSLSDTGSGATDLNGNVTTTGNQTYSGPVLLGADDTLSTTNSSVTFSSTVNGPFALSVAAGSGTVSYNGTVGGIAALTSLNDTGSGTTDLNANVTTTGNQSYSGPVLLGANDTLSTANSNVTFGSTVDGAYALTVAAGSGTVNYNGAVGITMSLASLSDTGSGTTDLSGNVTTTGTQTYSGSVVLGATATQITSGLSNGNALTFTGAVTLDASSTQMTTGGGNVLFGSAVDGTTSGTQGLMVNAGSGTFTYNGAIGEATTLNTLTVKSGFLSQGPGGAIAANSVTLNVSEGSIGTGSLISPVGTQYNIPEAAWSNILGPLGFIHIATSTLNISVRTTNAAANVFIDVSPENEGSNVQLSQFSAGGDIVITSMSGDHSGTLNIDNVSAGGHVLIYTQATGSNVALGTLHSSLNSINSIVVDAGGTLSQLAGPQTPYIISTGTSTGPGMTLLQLEPNLTVPRDGVSLDASSQLIAIYTNYNFFQIQKTFPSPTESIIRPLQVNSITATVGISGEKGWHYTINWGDGTTPEDNPVTSVPLLSNSPPTYSFSHDFTTLNAAAKYQITFTIYIDHSISLATHSSSSQTFYEQRTLSATALASAVPPPASLFAPQKQIPLATAQAIAVAPIGFTQPFVKAPDEIQLGTAEVQNLVKKKFLTMRLIPEDGSNPVALSMTDDGSLKVVAGSSDEKTQLHLDLLNGDQLIEQFKGLPDGRYQLNLHRNLGDETLDERTVLETVIINGAPLNPVEEIIDRLRRNLDREIESERDGKSQIDGASLQAVPNGTLSVEASRHEIKSLTKVVSEVINTKSKMQR